MHIDFLFLCMGFCVTGVMSDMIWDVVRLKSDESTEGN